MRSALRLINWAGALLCASALLLVQPVVAKQADVPLQAQVPFRILDQERLLNGSELGQQILARIHQAEQALQAENDALFNSLSAQERELTDLRSSLSPEEFRARADAFDAHVEAIRAERNQRSQTLTRQSTAQAQSFFDMALPILVQLMNEEGIVALLKPDTLILGSDWLDITDEAIRRLDAAHLQPAAPAQELTPQVPEPEATPIPAPEQQLQP